MTPKAFDWLQRFSEPFHVLSSDVGSFLRAFVPCDSVQLAVLRTAAAADAGSSATVPGPALVERICRSCLPDEGTTTMIVVFEVRRRVH
jgi:hypothetical protein